MLKWFLEESVNQAPFDGHHATILMKSNELFSKNCHKLNLAFIFVCFFGGFAPAICLTGCGNSHIPSPSVSAIENSIDSPSGIEESVSGDNDNGVTIISDSSSLKMMPFLLQIPTVICVFPHISTRSVIPIFWWIAITIR